MEEKVLKNGLKILFEKNKGKAVYLGFLIKGGGINEQENKKGISHFIEHMIYSGTKKRTREEILYELEKNGGMIQGLTSDTSTVHLCTFNKKDLDSSLKIILDMLKNTQFNEEEIKKERKIILEEVKTRKDNKLIYSVDSIQKMLFKKPFGEKVIGTPKNIKSFTRKDLFKWYKKYYVPENMTLSIIGDIDLNKVVKVLNKEFISKNSSFKRKNPIPKKEQKDVFNKEIKQSVLAIAYHLPKTNEKGFYSSLLFNAILNEGMSSRLFQKIRSKKNLCYNIFGGVEANKYYSIGTIFVEAKKQNLDKIELIITEEFQDIANNLTGKELKQVKNKITKKDQLDDENKKQKVLSILEKDNAEMPQDIKIIQRKILEVTLDEVKDIPKNILQNGYSRFRLISK